MALLTVLHFPGYKRALLGTTILANGKGHFDRNDQTGHRIFRSNQTEMGIKASTTTRSVE